MLANGVGACAQQPPADASDIVDMASGIVAYCTHMQTECWRAGCGGL